MFFCRFILLLELFRKWVLLRLLGKFLFCIYNFVGFWVFVESYMVEFIMGYYLSYCGYLDVYGGRRIGGLIVDYRVLIKRGFRR